MNTLTDKMKKELLCPSGPPKEFGQMLMVIGREEGWSFLGGFTVYDHSDS